MLLLVLLIVFGNRYGVMNAVPNWILILAIGVTAIAVVGIKYILYRNKLSDRSKMSENVEGVDNGRIFTPIILCTLFAFQLFMWLNITFRTSWDSQAVLYCARYAAEGDREGMAEMAAYLSRYPSNLLLVWIYSLIFRLNLAIHLTGDVLNLIVIMQCTISTFTAYLTYKCAYMISGRRGTSYAALIFYIALTGISAWVVIPYSDSTGLFLPILLLYFLIKYIQSDVSYRYLYLFIIGFMTYFSFRIKPEIIIVVIAAIVIAATRGICRMVSGVRNASGIKGCLIGIAAAVAGFCLSVLIVNSAIDSMGYELDAEAELGWQFYIMQGVNPNTYGGNSDSDVLMSSEIPTMAERNAVNLEIAKERIHELGIGGMIKLLAVKIFKPICSGTFGWGGVGENFYHETYPPRLGALSELMRRIFWEDVATGTPTYYNIYSTLKQIIWLIILGLVPCSVIRRRALGTEEQILTLAILGLILYFCIFESHPRYMIVQSPFLCIMAAMGISELQKELQKLQKKIYKG